MRFVRFMALQFAERLLLLRLWLRSELAQSVDP
jgi:hypothetical protein